MGSSPSSIFAGIPPAYPWKEAASILAVFALCEFTFTVVGDLFSRDGGDDTFFSCSGVFAGDSNCLSLFTEGVRGETRPFCDGVNRVRCEQTCQGTQDEWNDIISQERREW